MRRKGGWNEVVPQVIEVAGDDRLSVAVVVEVGEGQHVARREGRQAQRSAHLGEARGSQQGNRGCQAQEWESNGHVDV